MLLIPLPLLIKARLPWKRKAVLCGVFSLGICVILAAILNRYYNFTAGYGSLIYLNWYAGEASTAVIVTNIPHCWPLLATVFRLGSFKSTPNNPSSQDRFQLSSNTTSRRRPHLADEHGYIRSESEERIAITGASTGNSLEMKDLEHGEGYVGAAVTAGNGDKRRASQGQGVTWPTDEEGIVKTVQMHQYSQ